MKRVIVCAAIKNPNGEIICGVRHFDSVMINQISARIDRNTWHDARQGFMDNSFAFLTRHEAWEVASAAGQIIRKVGGDGIGGGNLFSENLY